MTKEDARLQLAGTWNFGMLDGKVLVADEALLAEIQALTESTHCADASLRAGPLHRPTGHGAQHAFGHA